MKLFICVAIMLSISCSSENKKTKLTDQEYDQLEYKLTQERINKVDSLVKTGQEDEAMRQGKYYNHLLDSIRKERFSK